MNSKQFVGFFCSCESLYFPACVNVLENLSLHRLARIRSQFTAQDWLQEKNSDSNADMDCYAVPPPEYQAGGDSKRENLCQQDSEESTRRRLEHQAPGNWKRLEHQAPGDQLLQKIPQLNRELIFNQILTETWKFDDPAKRKQAAERGEARILQSRIEQYMCKIRSNQS